MSADSVPELATLLPPPIAAPHERPRSIIPPPSTELQCGSCDARLMPRDKMVMNRSIVCPSCCYGFANRRQLAFALDILFFSFCVLALSSLIHSADPAVAKPLMAFKATGLQFLFLAIPVFLLKDGFAGYSPGKFMMGVQTLDRTTWQPAGFVASLKRTLPLLVPLMPIVVGLQLKTGTRLGDEWANTCVVNRRINWRLQVSAQAIPDWVARREYVRRMVLAGILGFAVPLYVLAMLTDLRPVTTFFQALASLVRPT